jgi:hypothetical protein
MVNVVEIGPYRGVQAVVNGQQFAITIWRFPLQPKPHSF